jgi:S-adenosylmethionine:tRNA ribosyltransferase-isomerase
MSTPDFDDLNTWQFALPPELIASRPTPDRDGARLLVIDRTTQQITHSTIRELPQWLQSSDLLVFNNTRVLPARLFGVRTQTGGRWEGLYLETTSEGHWHLLCETRGRLVAGETVDLQSASEVISTIRESHDIPGGTPSTLRLKIIERTTQGSWLMEPDIPISPLEVLERFGTLPLPPYMGRRVADDDDQIRYQTAFASEPGAVAAPTAGLHFTPKLLQDCAARGVQSTELTLHVGIGTFRPIAVRKLSEHRMHEEWCRLPQSTCDRIHDAKSRHGRILAVGTTSIRTLESSARIQGLPLKAWEGRTDLFIRPGYSFQVVNGLLTNFHLPGSTLIVLVAAFAGYDLIMEAYQQAIRERYRFYSYGDAMLIV